MLGVRLDEELERRLEELARRQGRTKSAVARDAIRRYLAGDDLAAEARRQSLNVAGDPVEAEVLDFVGQAADTSGWE